ncbi:MAG: DUF393 domain-containing protein [Granulosicoccus sp.]|nr:DUF393 domain-containing protein [Granulosicoccus sp.]
MNRFISDKASGASSISIIYDGECPVCTAYVRHVRLRQNFSQIKLVNARENLEIAQRYRDKGMSLDDGMVVLLDDSEFYAADAINVIALLSSSSGLFNRLNALIFRHQPVAKIFYPLMKSGRALLLRMLGRSKIDQ